MKLFSKVLLFVAMAAFAGALVLAQGTGAISGKVVDRDGKTPVVGATVQIESLMTDRGQQVVRERLSAKTGRDGGYSLSGVYQGRVRLTLMMNNAPVMVLGDKVGDELYVASGLDLRANFDLSKAPAAPPAAAAAVPAPTSEADREALRERLKKEAEDEASMRTAFDAAKAAFDAKNYPEAVAQFKIAAEKGPKVDIIWANLARAQDMNKQYEDAIASYQKAIELAPKPESNYYLNLGVVQFSAGKVEEGEASIKKSVELNPANAGLAYYNLGATMVNRGKSKEAGAAFQEAIKRDPNYANAYYELAIVYFGSQETIPQAVPLLEQYLKLAPNGANATGAKALLDAAKATSTTVYQSPEAAAKAKADAEKAKGKTKE